MVRTHSATSAILFVLCSGIALAQPAPDGIDWVTIGSPGNAPWPGNGTPQDQAIGRGRTDYEYRIGRFEVTTAQWVRFFNAAFDRPQSEWIPHLSPPVVWGAGSATPNTPGGLRWAVSPQNEMRFAGGITWRTAAIYTNWLHNSQTTERGAFLDGAYDVSTFGANGNIFTDQAAHHPNARYWIPTWDEMLKASHFDPNRNGPGQPGWWTYNNGTDQQLIGGPPPSMGGSGQANFGFRDGTESAIPLGAYSMTTSPSGLYDSAGATAEWTEEVLTAVTGERYRVNEGSFWGSSPGFGIADSIFSRAAEFPDVPFSIFGARIASAVPSGATCTLLGLLLAYGSLTRRRSTHAIQCATDGRDLRASWGRGAR